MAATTTTNFFFASNGTSYSPSKFVSVLKPGGDWVANVAPAKAIWEYNASNIWEGRYSSPTLSISGVSGSSSGTGSTGLVTTPAANPIIGGTVLGTIGYLYAYVSGDAGITCSSTTAANPTWSKTLGGYSNATWNLTITDNQTGAKLTSQNFLVEVQFGQTATPVITVFGQVIWGYIPSGHITTTCQAQAFVTPGGSGPYTFSWSYQSGFTGFTISNPNTQNPYFYDKMQINFASGTPPQVDDVGTWICNITGANGYVAQVIANIEMQGSILNAT